MTKRFKRDVFNEFELKIFFLLVSSIFAYEHPSLIEGFMVGWRKQREKHTPTIKLCIKNLVAFVCLGEKDATVLVFLHFQKLLFCAFHDFASYTQSHTFTHHTRFEMSQSQMFVLLLLLTYFWGFSSVFCISLSLHELLARNTKRIPPHT